VVDGCLDGLAPKRLLGVKPVVSVAQPANVLRLAAATECLLVHVVRLEKGPSRAAPPRPLVDPSATGSVSVRGGSTRLPRDRALLCGSRFLRPSRLAELLLFQLLDEHVEGPLDHDGKVEVVRRSPVAATDRVRILSNKIVLRRPFLV